MKPHRTFQKQFQICSEAGLTKGRTKVLFKEHPELLPAFPNKKMREDIKAGKWDGIEQIVCGKFGGKCCSSNAACQRLRGKI